LSKNRSSFSHWQKRKRKPLVFACAFYLVHIPKFRNGTGKILANASTPDFSGASDIILGYALIQIFATALEY
jgi:hypothetical protein